MEFKAKRAALEEEKNSLDKAAAESDDDEEEEECGRRECERYVYSFNNQSVKCAFSS